jgi:amino acid adenylation domain-containing protein
MSKLSASAERTLSTLSGDRAKLLRLLREEQSRRTQKISPYPRDPGSGSVRLPASQAQKRLWFIDQLEGGSTAYHITLAVRLQGELDSTALALALNTVVRRHEILRTVFVSAEVGLEQEIKAEDQVTLQLVDLSDYDGPERQAEAKRQQDSEAQAPFDLSTGPLIRGRLLRITPREHILLITMHHIVSDGWSLSVFGRELTRAYEAYLEGHDDPLDSLPIQYADYARWQQESLHGDLLERQLDYWRSRLLGAASELELPTDRPRPTVQTHRGSSIAVLLDSRLTKTLRSFARQQRITLFMTLYAGWAILLSRLSNQEDVLVGTPVANRPWPELEGMIGLFVNTLVLRVGVQGDWRVADFLDQVKKVTLGAYEHQDIPFERLVEALQPQRNLSRNPLFQVMLALQNAPESELRLPGLSVTREDPVEEPAMFDLLLSLGETGEEITGTLNYATDLFDRATVQRWITYFEVLLQAMTADVTRRISELPWIPDSERHQVIELFNPQEPLVSEQKLIHERFEDQVCRLPDARAVVYQGQSLTYADLNTKANQLARHLRTLGVGPEHLVAICVERSLEMVVGLLSVLKAGGAYVPLDPDYPAERLAYMINDAAPQVVLTQARLKGRLPESGAQVVSLDEDWPEIALQDGSNIEAQCLQEGSNPLAYVIYTSGSTGRPKGVMVEHRNVTRLFQSTQRWFGFDERDVWTLFHSVAFDFSVWELWGALLYGGRVVVVPYLTARSPQEFYRLLCDEKVTVLNQTPSAFIPLIEAQARARAHSSEAAHRLRVVIFGGEALELRALRPWIEHNGTDQPQLVNMYGITETTVHVTYRRLSREMIESDRDNLIGKPIPDLRVVLLDRYEQPVPIGVAGEIHVGGAGVARGYLNRPELTAERFRDDLFSKDSSVRLYKSGDLGRWRPDGTIEYLGRNDHQVKIRGFRIELGEIEAQLARHPEVKEALVLARETVPGEKRLIAYVTARTPSDAVRSLSAVELRAHLKAALPDHMIPSAFVTLARFPLTPNGKLDRRALPDPQPGELASRQYEAPQGEVEEVLAGIWQSLLRVERVSRHDNFFELGGHSLLIVQMLERLRRIGLSAEVRRVFESPTLSDLARTVTHGAKEQYAVAPNRIPLECESITPEMLPLVQLEDEHIERIVRGAPGGVSNIQDIYPLTPLQEGILFHHLLDEKREDVYVRPMLLSVASRDRVEDLIAAVQATIDRHDVLRTAILWEGFPQAVQVVYRQVSLPVETIVLDRNRDPLEQLRDRMSPDQQRLELREAPLMRVQIAADPWGSQWYVLLQTHHLVVDNESLEVLLSEVRAHLAGRAQELPDPVPYRNHVAQALEHARTSDTETFFRNKLADVDESTAPFGLVDVHGDGSQIRAVSQALEVMLSRKIRLLARRYSVSTATLFHAAWSLVIGRTSGRDDVVFGTVLLGRLQGNAGSQHTLGMFINTLPLRLKLEHLAVRELVEQTQRELVELLNHEQASLTVAQRCSGIPGNKPLFSALLNYRHSVSEPEAEWSNAGGVRVLASEGRTNYPVVLSVDDESEGFRLTMETDCRLDCQRMVDYTITTLHSLVAALEEAPQTLALSLSILPEPERQQVLEGFNASEIAYPERRLIHEVFEEQAQRSPDAGAVTCEERTLTYAELNAKANQVARYLRDRGVGADGIVGLCVERSLELVVGLLGILKSGGAYLPLDPTYPAERLAYMLNDAAPNVLLIQERLREKLPQTAAEVIALDTQWNGISQHSSDNLDATSRELSPRHLAYVIYTSGSTGRPKGVMVEHGNVTRLFAATSAWFNFNERDVWTLFHSFAFDFSVWELWGALLYGGRVVVVPHSIARSPQEFYHLVCDEQVTVLNQTPSAFMNFVDAQAEYAERQNALRVVIFGGEALELRNLQPWATRNGTDRPRLVNMYGITETTVHVTYRSLTQKDIESERSSLIGRPIPDLDTYILDRHRQPVPIGVPGELYVGGAGVARGYLNRPELTQERFIPHPFSTDPQARLYKTGDLGRWRADGTIEYLGRNDTQVKIRGFRIELGEIESRLLHHPEVKEAVVLAREDEPGEKRLVAYVTLGYPSRTEAALSAEALRGHVKAALPDHMVPSAFVILKSFPLTPNGKIDRRALPAPELGAYAHRQYEAPQGQVEEILAGIWQGLLRVPRVGRHDHFFELGGHSLLIVQMMERLRRFGLSAEVRRVFENPKLSDLAALLSRAGVEELEVPPNRILPGTAVITPQMLSLVELEAEHIERIVRATAGGAANIQDIYPLAPLQEGILFHCLLNERGGDTYVLPMLLQVSSREKLDELIAALQVVIDRHDVLRTAVQWERLPQPVQVVYRQATLPVEEIDLNSGQDPIQQLQDRMRLEWQRFDLRQAPLLRLQWAADPQTARWYVLLQMHHITCDHLTSDAIVAEVVARLEGRQQRLPEAIAYRNHVAQALAYAKKHNAESFFRRKLGDVDAPTAPFGLLDVHGDGREVLDAHEELEPALAQRVRAQSRRLGVSAATLFHAAWGLVVARTSERDDVVYGTVLLGRLQGSAGGQRILGMFINTLPLRLRLEEGTAKEFVERTQRELVELLGHEQASLAAAQRCSGVSGSVPLFNSLLNYRHSAVLPDNDWSAARDIQVLAYRERTNYPILMSVDDLGEGFSLTAQTDPRIDPVRLTGYLRTAVDSLVTALEDGVKTRVTDLSIVPAHERLQVIAQFNATRTAYPREKLIHELFEEQVERTRGAVAVLRDSHSLTYSELNHKANQLAHYLRKRGVGPDQRVAICMDRDLEMVVGLLGILKAGGAYVPLDPNYPRERLEFMLADAAPKVLLCSEQLMERLPKTAAEVIVLDRLLQEPAKESTENTKASELGLAASHLVYVIYTSGSTGRPKGIAMEHRSMVNLVEWHRRTFMSQENHRVLQFAALSFDVAFQETFSTLCTGGTLVLLDEWVRRDAQALTELMRQHSIQRLFLPPMALQSLAEFCGRTGVLPTSLQNVITAGEQLRISPEITRLFQGLPGCRLHNHYGPTETHVVTALTLPENPQEWPSLPPIGRPLANTQIYLLGRHGQPVPIGVPGEMYIAGDNVARGYLNRRELTETRFRADPFGPDSKARMYQTGDLARWTPDGLLEYLGRNDHQVKIRGFRIELGEIESSLARHPQVKEAVVLAREDVPGDKRLVAYVTGRDSSAPSIEALRAHLKAELPDQMIPSAMVVLDRFPATPNGKLDRGALPAPELGAYVSRHYEAPSGAIETTLASIWQSLLHVARVGRQDNFFELGGHSLHGVRLMAQVAERLNAELSVITVFRHPTIQEMAQVIESSDCAGMEFEEGVF